jgi:glycyl-tRNA synthetase alpha subunit
VAGLEIEERRRSLEISVERIITYIAGIAVVAVVAWAVDDSAKDAKVANVLENVAKEIQRISTENRAEHAAFVKKLEAHENRMTRLETLQEIGK